MTMQQTPGVRRINLDNPDDLKMATETGLIWRTKFAQRGVDAIRSGTVKLADCKEVPPQIKKALGG